MHVSVNTTLSTASSDEAALKEKKKKEETKPPTRIPGMRNANKLLAKIVSPPPPPTPPTLHFLQSLTASGIFISIYKYILL